MIMPPTLKCSTLILFLFYLTSYAQNLQDLPTCAQSPALAAIGSTGCQASDFACWCKDTSFIETALAGAQDQCTPEELTKVQAFAQQLCDSVGVSLNATASDTAAATPSSTDGGSSTTAQVSQSSSAGNVAAPSASATSGADSWAGLRGGMWSLAVAMGCYGLWVGV